MKQIAKKGCFRSSTPVQNLTRRARAFLRAESGIAAMEFGMIAPTFLFLIFVIFETSIFYYKQSHLKFVLHQAGRDIQTGEIQKSSTPLNDFQAGVCADAADFFKCSDVYLDVRSYATLSAVTFPTANFDADGVPSNFVFQPGGASQITAMRASATYNFITPFLTDIMQPDGKPVMMVGFSIFKNEPF